MCRIPAVVENKEIVRRNLIRVPKEKFIDFPTLVEETLEYEYEIPRGTLRQGPRGHHHSLATFLLILNGFYHLQTELV